MLNRYCCYVLVSMPIMLVVHIASAFVVTTDYPTLRVVDTITPSSSLSAFHDISSSSSSSSSSFPTNIRMHQRRRRYYNTDYLMADDRIQVQTQLGISGDDEPTIDFDEETIENKASSSSLSSSSSPSLNSQAKIISQLERTRNHLEKLQQRPATRNVDPILPSDPIGIERERIYESYIKLPASDLKKQCAERQINDKGRKPDLAMRLTQDDIVSIYGLIDHGKDNQEEDMDELGRFPEGTTTTFATSAVLTSFAGLSPLSAAAQAALTHAQFLHPTNIQARAIPILTAGRSALIHAATGSGKTLAYLLPFTERLWREYDANDDNGNQIALILTPTRELAAQVAGIASILAPPGTVRFVTRPSNLLSRTKQERADGINTVEATTRIYVGSAKAIYQSLYGDGRMPASPTTKPEAMYLLQNTGYLVLDEVDRLLGIVGGVNNNIKSIPKYDKRSKSQDVNVQKGINHEKPAAILTAAVARLALGKATTVAASATVGRSLRRELARCMGLAPQECPIIVRDSDTDDDNNVDATSEHSIAVSKVERKKSNNGTTATTVRAVTIPSTVEHYVIPVVDGTSPGKILTTAFTAIQSIGPHRRMLLVLTRNFGITTQNAIGALKHFKCLPEPISLLDALETTDGTEAMMEVHRQVTGVTGVGGSQPLLSTQPQQGYLLVTGEDSVRGLHLDGLDVVLVASRSVGPDEYTHIAGRTGRAGKSGSVVNVVSDVDVSKVTAWEKMLNLSFTICPNPKEIGSMIGNDVKQ